MPILYEVNHLDVSFNSTPVLKGLSFDVRQGEFLGIIGPNGSGKSTLLRAMAGSIPISGGSIKLDGTGIADFSRRDLARRLGVVPQESPIAFEYTTMEIVLMGRAPHMGRFQLETRRDNEIALDALRRANLVELADRRVSDLSGGERQRVIIARVLAQDTDIIFLDEPTAHLDIKYQVEVLHLARRENVENGKTVVVVLHDLNLAAEFCDRLIMLREGELYAAGTSGEVITAENVRNVYHAAVWVRRHPTSGRPYVLSMASPAVVSELSGIHVSGSLKVHVICGGGSGGPVFASLLEVGCKVTAGVINIGDSDQEAAETFGIEYVEDAPFSAILEKADRANLDFIERADAVIVADTPFGVGNLANLHGAARASDLGKAVAVIGNPELYAERDFAGGEVTRLLNVLIANGAVVLESPALIAGWVAKSVSG